VNQAQPKHKSRKDMNQGKYRTAYKKIFTPMRAVAIGDWMKLHTGSFVISTFTKYEKGKQIKGI
jgi:hypothetical protein